MKLSVIVLNYNTKDLISACLASLEKVRGEIDFEVIVADNGSSDGSVEAIKNDFKWVRVIENGQNLGFAAGNNKARSVAKGDFILFLNSDTEVYKNTLKSAVGYLQSNKEVGVVTCKMLLPDGSFDPDARRSFPTPWVAFTHFSGLDRFFPKSRLFAKYWYGFRPANKTQEIDVVQGAFFLTRKEILDKVGWFDETYFLDGEDIDLSWRIKREGWKLVYLSDISILHVKKATKKKVERRFVSKGVDAMEIFYRKHLWSNYTLPTNILVLIGIKLIKFIRKIGSFSPKA